MEIPDRKYLGVTFFDRFFFIGLTPAGDGTVIDDGDEELSGVSVGDTIALVELLINLFIRRLDDLFQRLFVPLMLPLMLMIVQSNLMKKEFRDSGYFQDSVFEIY
uniref:Uncharacterized protein n=1 Tax=Romanomermis culicivorax TaxID=13658 RepID=A0A915ICK2_ROMCU